MYFIIAVLCLVFGGVAGGQNEKWLMVSWFAVAGLFCIADTMENTRLYIKAIIEGLAKAINDKSKKEDKKDERTV